MYPSKRPLHLHEYEERRLTNKTQNSLFKEMVADLMMETFTNQIENTTKIFFIVKPQNIRKEMLL